MTPQLAPEFAGEGTGPAAARLHPDRHRTSRSCVPTAGNLGCCTCCPNGAALAELQPGSAASCGAAPLQPGPARRRGSADGHPDADDTLPFRPRRDRHQQSLTTTRANRDSMVIADAALRMILLSGGRGVSFCWRGEPGDKRTYNAHVDLMRPCCLKAVRPHHPNTPEPARRPCQRDERRDAWSNCRRRRAVTLLDGRSSSRPVQADPFRRPRRQSRRRRSI